MEDDTKPQSSTDGMVYQVDTRIVLGSTTKPDLPAQPTATDAAKPQSEPIYTSNSTLVFVRDN